MTICPRKELTLRFHLAVLYIRLLQFVKDRAFYNANKIKLLNSILFAAYGGG